MIILKFLLTSETTLRWSWCFAFGRSRPAAPPHPPLLSRSPRPPRPPASRPSGTGRAGWLVGIGIGVGGGRAIGSSTGAGRGTGPARNISLSFSIASEDRYCDNRDVNLAGHALLSSNSDASTVSVLTSVPSAGEVISSVSIGVELLAGSATGLARDSAPVPSLMSPSVMAPLSTGTSGALVFFSSDLGETGSSGFAIFCRRTTLFCWSISKTRKSVNLRA